jgi:hypothetical protein
MTAMWLLASYLVGRARCRARAALDGNPESGALSLEWIVIAVAVAGAAAAVGALILASINKQAAKLP